MNQWEALVNHQESPRKLFLYNIDESRAIMGVRVGDWKLISGHTYKGGWDGHYGPSGRGPAGPHLPYNISDVRHSLAGQCLAKVGMPLGSDEKLRRTRSDSTISCPPPQSVEGLLKPCKIKSKTDYCLINIRADPCETNDLKQKYPEIVELMFQVLEEYKRSEHKPVGWGKGLDKRADPKYFNYTWTNYLDYYEPLEESVEAAVEHVPFLENTDSTIQNTLLDNILHLDYHYSLIKLS